MLFRHLCQAKAVQFCHVIKHRVGSIICDKHVPAPTKSALRILGESSKTDVLGSYTGIPENKDERPVQDADDL